MSQLDADSLLVATIELTAIEMVSDNLIVKSRLTFFQVSYRKRYIRVITTIDSVICNASSHFSLHEKKSNLDIECVVKCSIWHMMHSFTSFII